MPTPNLIVCDGQQVPAVVHVSAREIFDAMPETERGQKNVKWTCPTATGYTRLPGFNAAFRFEKPGKHTIQLTVADRGDKNPRDLFANFTLDPNTRKQVIVHPKDKWTWENDDNVWAKFTPEHHPLTTEYQLHGRNLLLEGAGATLDWQMGRWGVPFALYGANPYICGFNLDAAIPGAVTEKNGPTWFRPRCPNFALVDVSCARFCDVVNCNARPVGVLMHNVTAPTVPLGGFGYPLWAQGRCIVVVGCNFSNVTGQHELRNEGTDELLVYGSHFANDDTRAIGGPSYDVGKGGIVHHAGKYAWIEKNELHSNTPAGGPLGWGPLNAPGVSKDAEQAVYVVIKGNVIERKLIISPGARFGRVVNNRAHELVVQSIDNAATHRYVEDIAIVGNAFDKVTVNTTTLAAVPQMLDGKGGTYVRNVRFGD
jgi:hypothetical protein